ncbi:hypothetical protein NDU88_008168 [Pleurodeles waltl]|uniref:Uncharacterized protein n=1 Tax=Pleurodeles waltl TaxID=8319 RepID=A0AAV7VWF1_PLEWA|nr:hypothetical protein NDU88_008168 [Pleurodeles waltl]
MEETRTEPYYKHSAVRLSIYFRALVAGLLAQEKSAFLKLMSLERLLCATSCFCIGDLEIRGLVRIWTGPDTNTAWEVAWAGSAPDWGPQRDCGDWRGFTLAGESRREDDRVKSTGEVRK